MIIFTAQYIQVKHYLETAFKKLGDCVSAPAAEETVTGYRLPNQFALLTT